jgi:hypothetical protein
LGFLGDDPAVARAGDEADIENAPFWRRWLYSVCRQWFLPFIAFVSFFPFFLDRGGFDESRRTDGADVEIIPPSFASIDSETWVS